MDLLLSLVLSLFFPQKHKKTKNTAVSILLKFPCFGIKSQK